MSDERDRDQGEEWWARMEQTILEHLHMHRMIDRTVRVHAEVDELERMWTLPSVQGN